MDRSPKCTRWATSYSCLVESITEVPNALAGLYPLNLLPLRRSALAQILQHRNPPRTISLEFFSTSNPLLHLKTPPDSTNRILLALPSSRLPAPLLALLSAPNLPLPSSRSPYSLSQSHPLPTTLSFYRNLSRYFIPLFTKFLHFPSSLLFSSRLTPTSPQSLKHPFHCFGTEPTHSSSFESNRTLILHPPLRFSIWSISSHYPSRRDPSDYWG